MCVLFLSLSRARYALFVRQSDAQSEEGERRAFLSTKNPLK
jgi:hypothetical protein